MAKKEGMEYIERNNVFFAGLDNVHPDDQQQIKDIIHRDYIELERELKRINSLKLTFKTYEHGGKKKYSAELMIDAHMKPITVNHMSSPVQWDPVAIVHKLMEKARKEIAHKFKIEGGGHKLSDRVKAHRAKKASFSRVA
jgi:hypothetical protein